LPARSSAAQSVLDALRDGVDALPEECRPILIPLALHDTLVAAEHLERIAEVSGTGASAADAAHALASLTRSGLLAKADDGLYFVHPLLPIYVRSRVRPGGSAEEVERWIRTFVEFWAFEAQRIATADIPQASRVLARLEPTLLTARRIAGVHEMRREAITLIQALAGSAQDRHDFERALAFYAELVDEGRAAGDREVVAIAEHQLGMCHQQRGDLPSAEQHYLRSLEIKTDATNGADEARGDPARTKYQLGVLATEREDLATAERWFSEALDLASANNEDLVASALQAQAGLALRRNDLVRAENLYRRVEEIKKRSDKRAALGSLYHQYGRLEQQKGNREAAIRHYEAALAIAVEYHSPEGQAKALFQIGQIRRELGDLNEAESLVLKALEIEERFGMKENIAKSCHELGFIAQSRPDFARARLWFDRSLQIWNELRNTAEERAVLHHLGMIAIAKGDFDLAEEQLLSSLELAFQEKNAWAAATTCAELGQLNARQRQFAEAAHWVVRGLGLSRIASDRSLHDSLIQNFLAYYCRDEAEPERAAMDLEWQKTGLPPELPRGTLASTRRTAKLERAIEGMPDRDAEALLHRLLGDLDPPDPPRGQALRALVDELVEGVGRRPGEAPSTDGAIARNALKLLAIWPEHGERIRSLMDDSGTGAAVPRTLTGVRTNQLVVAVLGLAGIVTFDATKGAWRPTDRRRAGPEGLLAAFANQVINRDDRTFW
jgi:tetratricopeptide (TPR) repeat protein